MAECPVSAITPESLTLLALLDSNAAASNAASATLYGPDLSQHPAWWSDAIRIIDLTRRQYEAAEMQALSNARH
jgi:hypothetical protein